MSDLPPGWEWTTLEELAAPVPRAITDGPFGSNLKTEHYTETGPRMIRLQKIGDGAFIDERAHISQEHFERLQAHSAEPGDVVVAALGETLPRACVVPEWLGPAIVKADCLRFRLHPEVNPHFVIAMLNSPHVRDGAAAEISGVGRPRLNLAKTRALRVPVPPAAEQERIVSAIEEQLSRLDDAITVLERTRYKTTRLRECAIASAVAGSWKEILLAEVLLTLRNGVFVSRPAATGPGVPILRISAVRPNALDTEDIRWAPTDGNYDGYFVEPGDLLFTRYSGNPRFVGACAVVPANAKPCLHPDKLIRAVVDRTKANPWFVSIVVNTGKARVAVEARLKTTAGQVGIAGSQLREVPIPLPPLDEQERVVADVERQSSILDALDATVASALTRADSLRRAILAAAFRGELVPQDSTDEPASMLLERIAASRAARPSVRRPRRRGA